MDPDDHTSRLARDLPRLLAARRSVLQFLAGAGLAPVVGCGDGDSSDDGSTDECPAVPDETAGPYPGDGSNSNSEGVVNALTLAGIVRNDMRPGLGSASGTASGVPVTVELTVVGSADCEPIRDLAVYLWHCDRDGKYSLYDLVDQNYLRAVQPTDGAGVASFTTIFPGCYAGRSPHMHFEIFADLDAAKNGADALKTSQLTFPDVVCDAVYASAGYETSATNYAGTSLSTDNVFRDGYDLQIAEANGNVTSGYAIKLTVAVAM